MTTNMAGSGQLVSEGRAIGSVDYELIVVVERGNAQASGSLFGDPGLLTSVVMTELVLVANDDGREIPLLMTDCDRDGRATVQIAHLPDAPAAAAEQAAEKAV